MWQAQSQPNLSRGQPLKTDVTLVEGIQLVKACLEAPTSEETDLAYTKYGKWAQNKSREYTTQVWNLAADHHRYQLEVNPCSLLPFISTFFL